MNQPTTPSEIDRQDLDWQAFLYVCDEMPADASEAFEQLLADSQPVREALARAVEIRQALVHAAAPRPPAPGPATRAGRR